MRCSQLRKISSDFPENASGGRYEVVGGVAISWFKSGPADPEGTAPPVDVEAPWFAAFTSILVSTAVPALTSNLSLSAVLIEIYVELQPLLVHTRLDLKIPIELYVNSQPLLVHSRLNLCAQIIPNYRISLTVPLSFRSVTNLVTRGASMLQTSDRSSRASATFGEQDLWFPVGQTVDHWSSLPSVASFSTLPSWLPLGNFLVTLVTTFLQRFF